MGGNQAGRFSGPELYRVLNHRDSRIAVGGILENKGIYTSIDLPPYASLDTLVFEHGSMVNLSIDVLANDHDANGQTLTIHSYDSTSANGATITLQGQNLVYTPPNGAFLGLDSFSYRITDTSGKTATGIALVNVTQPPVPLRLYLPLDETTGTTANDASAYENSGNFWVSSFDTSSVIGIHGNAINLDGFFSRVEVTGVNLNSNTVTITTWVKQAASQTAWSGIVFDNISHSGLTVGTAGELRYSWNGGESNWNSGLTPPADTWTFVALVIEPTKVTIHMDSGSGFQSATRSATHNRAAFGSTQIGADQRDPLSRFYTGGIDDVRIYDYSMTESQLRVVYNGGGVENPSPFDGAWGVDQIDLSWSPALDATQYQVYLGTDKIAVQTATTASTEYLGTITSSSYPRPTLAPETTYYWRVDAVRAGETLTGKIWKFTRSANSSIAIVNHSFEQPNTSKQYNWESVPGWSSDSVASDSGVESGQSPTNGSWTGFLGEADPSVWNLTNQAIAAGEAYTLKLDARKTVVDASSIRIMLYYDNAGIRTTVVTHDAAISDNMQEVSVTFHADDMPAAIGKKIGIEIDNVAGAWLGFDNVRLTKSGIPRIPPSWNSGSIAKVAAAEDAAYSSSLASDASDPESDTLIFSKVSGPEWLQVAEDGTLSGTPLSTDIGLQSWEVAVTDLFTTPVLATLNITVTDSPDAPVFINDPIAASSATKNVAYTGSIAGSATDEDVTDMLSYSKVNGPAWLVISNDGSLSGMAGASDAGLNAFTVKVSDGNGGEATATLNITVSSGIQTPFSDDFERTAGNTIGNGWIEISNDSRLFDTSASATKMVISQSAGQAITIVNPTGTSFIAYESYELNWNGARAAGDNGTLVYDVAIGTWDGSSFTPLTSQTGSLAPAHNLRRQLRLGRF